MQNTATPCWQGWSNLHDLFTPFALCQSGSGGFFLKRDFQQCCWWGYHKEVQCPILTLHDKILWATSQVQAPCPPVTPDSGTNHAAGCCVCLRGWFAFVLKFHEALITLTPNFPAKTSLPLTLKKNEYINKSLRSECRWAELTYWLGLWWLNG